MCMPQHRLGDPVVCALCVPTPAGPVPGPSATAFVCAVMTLVAGKPAARIGDNHVGVGPHPLVKGSATVLIQSMPASRMLDSCGCGGMAVLGELTVLTGG